MIARRVLPVLLFAGAARAAFPPGGLLDAAPRSVALAGADLALPDVPATAADYPLGAGTSVQAGYARQTAGGVAEWRLDASGTWEGLGFGGVFRRRWAAGTAERTLGIGLGVPVEEVPGLAFGVSLRALGADLGAAAATGLTAELSASAPVPSPVDDLALRAAVAVDPAFGSLRWGDGFEETPARQSRVGIAGRWRERVTGYAELRLVRGGAYREQIGAAGAEYRAAVLPHPAVGEFEVAMRVGYRGGSDRDGTATAGLGIGRGPARVEYAVAANTPGQGVLHAFSAGYRLEPGAGAGRTGPARAATGGDAGAAVPETTTARFDTPYRTLQIAIAPPHGFVVETWAVLVLGRHGEVVWSAEGNGLPPAAVEWNGTALDGAIAPAGSYECRLATRGPGAFRSFSAGAGFRLVRPAVKALPEPDGPGGF